MRTGLASEKNLASLVVGLSWTARARLVPSEGTPLLPCLAWRNPGTPVAG